MYRSLSKYGHAWQLPDNIWQQNQNCHILFSKWKRIEEQILILYCTTLGIKTSHDKNYSYRFPLFTCKWIIKTSQSEIVICYIIVMKHRNTNSLNVIDFYIMGRGVCIFESRVLAADSVILCILSRTFPHTFSINFHYGKRK